MKKLGESVNVKEAVKLMLKMKKYRPYEWSGKHYLINCNGLFKAYRSKLSAVNSLKKIGGGELWEVTI